jgi:4-hydroxybenzoate polyprenyltransferase
MPQFRSARERRDCGRSRPARSAARALVIAAALALAAFVLVLFLNGFAIVLSFLGLAIAATYPYSKRYISLPQAYLGIAFGFGIPMAYAAVHRHLPPECWMLLAANVFYAFAYDTEYAMVDRDDDARIGIRTSALTFGRWDVAAVMASYAAMLLLLIGVGVKARLGWPFYAGLAAAGVMMVYHWTLIAAEAAAAASRLS